MNEEKKIAEEENVPVEARKRLPRFAIVFYAIACVSVLLYIGFLCSPSFADVFNRRVGSVLRAALAHLTGWIPFSLAEFLLLLLPVILVSVSLYGIRRYASSWRNVGIFCVSMLSVAALVFSIFTVGFAAGYRGRRLDEKLGLQRKDVSAQELYDTVLVLIERLEEDQKRVFFSSQTNFSMMPYGYEEMNDRLLEAYDSVCEEYSFVQRLDSRLKPVMLSRAMSYTHITGVYTFFTGEANINVAFPDYTLPFTAAHELAHQRGIAREDEANFMAFLVCERSEDAYLRYVGNVNLLEYVLSALYGASPMLYTQAYMRLPSVVRGEMAAFSEFFEPYRDSVASEVSEAVNDTFLTMHGTEGTRSYGMVVDLAVAYFYEG